MPHLYGDSTVFPYDVDYIELSRHAVDCAVQLLSAQHAISSARERAEALSAARNTLSARVESIVRSVQTSLEPQLVTESAQLEAFVRRVVESVEHTGTDELVRIERQANEEISHTHNIMIRAGETAHRSLEAFLQRNDLPGTEIALSWAAAGEQDYAGQVVVRTPFGIGATFSLGVPPDHAWSRARRMADIAPGLEVHFPQQAGWLSKRVEMTPIKLDRLFLSGVQLDAKRAEFRLRKAASSGSGYRILADLGGDHQVSLEYIGEEGSSDTEPPLSLDAEDSAQMFRLASRVIESMHALAQLRRSMISVDLDAQPLPELDWPRLAAERLIRHIAPVVSEIGRRSGAPGELVLRRDVGDGRREEMYVTHAELNEKVLVLPPAERVAFEALGLNEAARNAPPAPRNIRSGSAASAPSAPAPSAAAQMAAVASVGPVV